MTDEKFEIILLYKKRFWKTCIDQPCNNFVEVPKNFLWKMYKLPISVSGWFPDQETSIQIPEGGDKQTVKQMEMTHANSYLSLALISKLPIYNV